jgi:DNA modification methylase
LDAWTEKHAQFLVVTKPDTWEKTIGLDTPKYKNPRPQGVAYNEFTMESRFMDAAFKQDLHATIKPTKLMSYLLHLSTRRGDLILDPFLGWGTTAIAASLFGRRFTGIEINLEYCQAAQKRVNYAIKNAFKFEDIVEEIEPKWKDEKLGDLA